MRGNGGEDARSDEQTNTDVEHRSGEVASTLESRENTRSSKEKHKSVGGNKRRKVTKQVIEPSPGLHTHTAADRARRYAAGRGSDVTEVGRVNRNEEGGGSDVIGNVDSGSSEQQESNVQVTPVESAFESQDGPS